MIKIIYYLLVVGIISVYAQPVIDESNAPQIGTKAEFVEYQSEELEEGPAGANQTWDFSNIQVSTEYYSHNPEFVEVSEGYHNELFPEATLAEKSDTAYSYFRIENNNLLRLGTGFVEGTELLTDYMTMMQMPFTYGNSFSDKFAGTIEVQGYELERSGTIEMEADGYGTLIVGDKTYNNVLRIKSHTVTKDSLPPPVPGMPGGASIVDIVTYSWIIQGEYYSVLSITEGTSTTIIAGQSFSNDIKNAIGVDYDADETIISVPHQIEPADGADGLELPVTFEWSESEVIYGGILKANIKNKDDIELASSDIQYTLEISENPDFNSGIMTFQTINTYEIVDDTYLDYEKTYYWRVFASANSGNSDYTEVWSFTTSVGSEKPEKPTLTSPVNNDENVSINPIFRWEDEGDADNWVIVVDNNPQFVMPVVEHISTEAFYELMVSLDYNSTYYWKVKAVSDGIDSEWSDIWEFTTEEGESNLPDPPHTLSPEEFAMDVSITPTFKWLDDEKADRWNLVVSDNSALQDILLNVEINDTIYEMSEELEPLTIYYWGVRAGNDDGWSEFGLISSFTTEDPTSVRFDISNSIVKVMPNPAQDYVKVEFTEEIKGFRNAKIIDINGALIKNISKEELLSGKINIGNIATGKYFLSIESTDSFIAPLVIE